MTADLDSLEQQYSLPSGLLSAVQHKEDPSGDPNAVSSAGAVGTFQFEPATAKQYGIDPTDPDQAAKGAAMMFSDLSKKYNGDVPSMLAAYNWGQGNLDRKGMENAPAETQDYIKTILPKIGKQYAQANTGNMTDANTDALPDPSKMSEAEVDAELAKLQGSQQQKDPSTMTEAEVDAELAQMHGVQQSPSLIDTLKNPPDTSFVSNYGQGFLDTANRSRLGIEGLGQAVGKALYGANPQDVAEEASRKASLAQLDQEKAASGVIPSGFGGVAGNIAGSIAGNPASWLPMGEISGVGDLARAGAIQGGASGLIQNTDKTSLGGNLLNAGIGAAEGAGSAAVLGTAGKTALEIPGGIANRVKGAFADSANDMAAQSDKNWEEAGNYFKSSTANGAVISDDSAKGILDRIQSDVGTLGSRTTGTAGVLQDFQKSIENGEITPAKLHDFRQDLNDVISKDTKSKVDGGGIGKDGQKAMTAKTTLDDALANLNEKDLSAGTPQGINDLLSGINSTAKAYRYDRVSDMLNDAGGDPNAIMRGAAKLQKSMKGLNPDEAVALQNLATRGTGQAIERGLGTFGFDLGKAKNAGLPALVAGNAVGAGTALVPHGLPLVAAGTVARQTGKLAAKGKAQNLLDTIMERETNAPPTPSLASRIYKVQQRAKGQVPAPAVNPYLNPNTGQLSKFEPNSEFNLTGKPQVPTPSGEISDYFVPEDHAKGGIIKNREIHLSKKLEVKLGRQPKAREVELASYVGAHGVHRLLNQKDVSMPAHKMFPQETVKQKRELFFNKKKPYTVEEIKRALV